jgi:hypothetical protein
MTSSAPLSRQGSNDTTTSPPTALKLLTIRTHTQAFSPNEVLINPALVPFAKPGSLLQLIPEHDIENESADASDRYIFRLGDESEKDVSTKYGNLQLSLVTEVAKAFKFMTGSKAAVALVRYHSFHDVNGRSTILLLKQITLKWHFETCFWIVRTCGD